MSTRSKKPLYTRYPASSVALYDGVTVVHFLLGGAALLLAYRWPVGLMVGAAYTGFAFLEMFLLMPLTVCPSCVYYRLPGSLCISGMNRWSRKIARPIDASRFEERARGALRPNNLYLVALGFPIIAVVPGLVLGFPWPVLLALVVLVALLVFWFFVIFPKVACVHYRAKNACPNARAMGLSAGPQPSAKPCSS
jgi:hypothetical protein